MGGQASYHIPNGPKNLAVLFPSVSWKDIEEYYVEILNLEGTVIGTTTRNTIGDITPAEDETIRLHFINSVGGVDAVNFCSSEEYFETKAETGQIVVSYPLVKSQGGSVRFNIQANETYKVTTYAYNEPEMRWLKELLKSPMVWLEWKGIQGQPDDYLPVLLSDTKVTTKKMEDRYFYEFTTEFKLSNQHITIRN